MNTFSKSSRVIVTTSAALGIAAAGIAVAQMMPPKIEKRNWSPADYRALFKSFRDTTGIEDDGFIAFAMVQAATESGFNNIIYRGNRWRAPYWAEQYDKASPEEHEAEAAASARAYERNPTKYAPSPYMKKYWTIGSLGLHGLLLPTSMYDFSDEYIASGRIAPTDQADPWISLVCLYRMCARVMSRSYWAELPDEYKNYWALKRAMRQPTLAADYNFENESSQGVQSNTIRKAETFGIDISALADRPRFGSVRTADSLLNERPTDDI